jgi:hypothetical protein
MLALQRPPKPVVCSCDPEITGADSWVPGGLPTLPFQEGTQDGVAGCIWLRGAINSQRGSSLFVAEVVVVVVLVVLAVAVCCDCCCFDGRLWLLISGAGGCFTSYTRTQENFLVGVVATLQLCSRCSTSSAGTMEELTQQCSSVTVLTVVVVCGC